jgi:hypothetical protein
MVFSLLKINYAYLMKVTSKQNIISKIRQNCLLHVDLNDLLTTAFQLHLTTSQKMFQGKGGELDYKANNIDELKKKVTVA